MEKVSISRLHDQLSMCLKKVQEGHTLVVTHRNKPVALLTPVVAGDSRSERLARLESFGLVARPCGRTVDLNDLLSRRPQVPGAGVLNALLAERRGGR